MSLALLPTRPAPAQRWSAAIAALVLVAGCSPDGGGLGNGSDATTGEASTTAPVATASTEAADTTTESLPEGPRKRRLDLDPALVAGMGGTTLLVVLDAQRIEYDHAQPDGSDLRFFDPEETIAFPTQIERWDPAGRSYVWVRINLPTLPDHLWMYYGEDDGYAAIDSAAVWDDDFAAVWHMEVGADVRLTDSTAHAHDLQPVGFTGNFDVDGFIGPAALFVPPAMTVEAGPLELPDPEALALTDGFTLEAWVWSAVTTTPITSHVVRKGNAYALHALEPRLTHPRVVLRTADGSGPHAVEAAASLTMHEWTYLAATYHAADGTLVLHRNGEPEGTLVVEGDAMGRAVAASPAVVQVGRALHGLLDEVRVSRIARSTAWIRLQHAAMSDALVTFGPPMAQ